MSEEGSPPSTGVSDQEFSFMTVVIKVLEVAGRNSGTVYRIDLERREVFAIFWRHEDCLKAGVAIDIDVGTSINDISFDLTVGAVHSRVLLRTLPIPSPYQVCHFSRAKALATSC